MECCNSNKRCNDECCNSYKDKADFQIKLTNYGTDLDRD